MLDLTDRQAAVLAMIGAFYARHQCGPAMRKLASDLGMSSAATAHEHVKALTRKGYLRYMGRLGYVPTGKRIEALHGA